MSHYKIFGRAGAGSLIAEFLLEEVGQDYSISFVSAEEAKSPEFLAMNPLGKIPVLIRPDGGAISETLAITTHLIEVFPELAPAQGSAARDRFWQYLAMLATCIYPAYHRQHHSYYYAPTEVHDDLRARARAEQATAYDYIETVLNPFLCGDDITAADFYLYMLTRWDMDRDALVRDRPALATFIKTMRARPAVDTVITRQKATRLAADGK